MPASADYVAFDLGASSGRAVLGAFDGQRLQLEEVHRFANGPVQVLDHLHWDVLRLFQEIKTGLAKCAGQRRQLDGVGIDTWGVDFGLISASGELLGLPVHYRDARTRGMCAEAFKRVSREEIYAKTGIQFMELNTLYQLLALARDDSAALRAGDTLLFMPDLLSYWLTGIRQSEYTIASTSQLLDAERRAWATDMLARLGLPAKIMPPVSQPGTPIGGLLSSVADETGIGPTTVIAPACHDTAAAVAAVPARGGKWAYISSGTWSLIGVELATPILNADALACNFTNEGGVAETIRFLRNAAGLWLVQECQRTWEAAGESLSYAELTDMAAAAPARVCFVDPDDARFAEPGDMPARIQDFCSASSQPVPQSKGEIVRCALESLALKYRVTIAELERLTGQRIEVVHIVGGGVRNELLSQLAADTTGKPVIAGPAEATAAGNIMVQALARGRVSSLQEVREVVARSTSPKQYEPGTADAWDEAYERFRANLPNRKST